MNFAGVEFSSDKQMSFFYVLRLSNVKKHCYDNRWGPPPWKQLGNFINFGSAKNRSPWQPFICSEMQCQQILPTRCVIWVVKLLDVGSGWVQLWCIDHVDLITWSHCNVITCNLRPHQSLGVSAAIAVGHLPGDRRSSPTHSRTHGNPRYKVATEQLVARAVGCQLWRPWVQSGEAVLQGHLSSKSQKWQPQWMQDCPT